MKHRKFLLLLVLAQLLLFSCVTPGESQTSESTESCEVSQESVESSDTAQEPAESDKVYYLQHRLIPNWVHNSDGAFYNDLVNGEYGPLREAAAEVVSPMYAVQIQITPMEEHNAVVILFPEPEEIPNCFYAVVVKNGETYSYFTYEKTLDWGDANVQGVLAEWDAEEVHHNYGARDYAGEGEFLEDVLSMLSNN